MGPETKTVTPNFFALLIILVTAVKILRKHID